MTTQEITVTDAQHLTVLKHLAGGKDLDVTATVTHLPRSVVLDIGSKHGYPNREKLGWAADIVQKKIDDDTAIPHGEPRRPAGTRTVPVDDDPVTPPPAAPSVLTRPDEIRVLLNTAKSHPSKRIQNAANRLFDQVGKLRELIAEDERKNAKKRSEDAAKKKLRDEVARLEKELRDARAKLRGTSTDQPQRAGDKAAASSGQLAAARASTGLLSQADLEPHGLTSKDLRTWAREHDIDVPESGRLPRRIFDMWLARNGPAAKAAS